MSGRGKTVIGRDGLADLVAILAEDGYRVIGPQVADGAVVYEPLDSADDLPAGVVDDHDGGHYRLRREADGAVFAHVVGPQSWKRYLYPPVQALWRAERHGKGFRVIEEPADDGRDAFIGVRPCDIRAMAVHDRVFDRGDVVDGGYARRRRDAFVVAVNCTRAGGTCFCVSMGTGPAAGEGFDLALTELVGDNGHEFLVEAGSAAGGGVLDRLGGRDATAEDEAAAEAAVGQAAASMGRHMAADAPAVLMANLESPHWDGVAARCLACGNCTMVCPTCFCTTVEDATDLGGQVAERRRRWDSCFAADHSYIHGGSVRRETSARYRQWITHKLATWHEQFGTSGCVGCGRCITWCPVGIDITEEVRTLGGADKGD